MKLTIDVKQCYIDAGVCGSPTECPIALAILGEHAICAKVSGHAAFLERAEKSKIVELPLEAMVFVANFDNYGGQYLSPFQFDLEIGD